jgi:LysM repeat protein
VFARSLSALVLAASLLAPGAAQASTSGAPKVHVVYQGQRLGSIAKRYNVSVEALRNANDIGPRDVIKPGQRLTIPERDDKDGSRARAASVKVAGNKGATMTASVTRARGSDATSHRVARGDTLGGLARRYGTTVDALSAVNGLRKGQAIRVGQVLVLPGASDKGGSNWQRYARASNRKGYLDISTHSSRFRGQVMDSKGRLRPSAVRALTNLFGAGGSHPPLPERLVRLLVRLSDTFGGRSIRVVSAYRTTSFYRDSRHKLSSAIDFSISGVPNAAVRDYLLLLNDVGVGYYPNSSFLHLDVRNHRAYWVDYAGPGEAPRKSPNAPRDPAPRSLEDLDDLAEQAAENIQRAGTTGSLPEAPPASAAEAAGAAAGAEIEPASAAPAVMPKTDSAPSP